MAEMWWTEGQAYQYLIANRPCENSIDARRIIEGALEDGTLSARYRRSDDTIVPIKREEWARGRRHDLEWSGHAREAERDAELGCWHGDIEFQAAPLQRLCTSQDAPTLKVAGRPPREIVPRLYVLAGMY